MAKKKSKNKGQQQPPLSPTRFMREKARNLPLGKCFISPADWQASGMTNIIVTRQRPNGNLVMATFLVDTFCLGVKDACYDTNMTISDFDAYLRRYRSGTGIEEISYDEAHNIIYGAIDFAEEGGIKPAKEFDPARYVLEEDTDDIPLIEYTFGKNGKHLLIVNPDRKEMPFYHILKENLGDDFHFVIPVENEDNEYYDEDDEHYVNSQLSDIDSDTLKNVFKGMSSWQEEFLRHPEEEYSYQYPQYPQTLSVKNQFIADELLSPDNYSCLPRKVIDRILALPNDEAAQDISNIILYSIAQTYKGINDYTTEYWNNSAIMHSLILLAHLQSERGLDAVLEVMRQTWAFADYHLGDLYSELLPPALYACGKDNIQEIEEYLNQPGLNTELRSSATETLALIVFKQPERRQEIIEVFRRLLNNMISNLPIRRACDGTFAGFVMGNLMDLNAKELIPEIKATFATDCVNTKIAGTCEIVVKEIEGGHGPVDKDKYKIPDIYTQYQQLKQFITKPD